MNPNADLRAVYPAEPVDVLARRGDLAAIRTTPFAPQPVIQRVATPCPCEDGDELIPSAAATLVVVTVWLVLFAFLVTLMFTPGMYARFVTNTMNEILGGTG